MNGIFSDMIGKGLLAYIDDVTIYSKTFDEHLQLLRKIFARLRKENLFLKPSKCTIATDRIQILGYVVDKDGLKTDPLKVAAVARFPRPVDRNYEPMKLESEKES